MQHDDIKTLYEYNYWATDRILAASALLSPEQYGALVVPNPGYGSLRNILVHMLDTERGWRERCQHELPSADLSEADVPTHAHLLQLWRAERATMHAYLGQLHDDMLHGLIQYTTDDGEARERVLWHVLLHVINHGTQHRSEAGAILTSYGASPGDLDFTVFLSEQQ